jgi:hypothetical protein
VPIGYLPPRLRRVSAEIRVQACEILRGHSTSTAASCPSFDLGLVQHGQKVESANLCGLAKEGPGSQSNAPKEGAPKEEEAGGDN